MKTLKIKKAERTLTVNDIVSPGEILDLFRDVMSRLSGLELVVIVTREKKGDLVVDFAGLVDQYHAAGYLEAAKLVLLESDEED